MMEALHYQSRTQPQPQRQPEVRVRRARQADIGAIADITRQAFLLYAQQVGLFQEISALGESEADVAAALRDKHVLVASVQGRIVGCVRYEDLGGGLGYLSRFGVDPQVQQGGVGTALLGAVREACRALGLSAIALHTGARVAHLVQFYYRGGYFIHSTTHERGYVRALFVQELDAGPYEIARAMAR